MKREQPDSPDPLPGGEPEISGESKEERRVRLNFFSDAVRAALHSASVDIMEQFEAGCIPDVPSCMLAGACQFIAELYEGIATRSGADKTVMRDHMLRSVETYFEVYCQMTVKQSLDAAMRQPKGKGERVQ